MQGCHAKARGTSESDLVRRRIVPPVQERRQVRLRVHDAQTRVVLHNCAAARTNTHTRAALLPCGLPQVRNDACLSNSSDVTCWLQPLSNCTTWVYQNQDNPDVDINVKAFSWPAQRYRRRANLSVVADTGTFGSNVDLSTEQFTDEPRRLFWLQSMLIGYLLRPNSAVLDFVEDRRRTLNIGSSPFIGLESRSMDLLKPADAESGSSSRDRTQQFYGVHIRRGDKKAEVQHREVSEYPEALRALAAKHSNLQFLLPSGAELHSSASMKPGCSVFLATDDDDCRLPG